MNRRKIKSIYIVVPIVMASVMVVSCLILAMQARTFAEKHIYSTMSSLAEKQSTAICMAVDGRFTTLEAYANSIEASSNFYFASSEAQLLLKRASVDPTFSSIFIANNYGTAYSADYNYFDVSENDCYTKSLSGKRAINKESCDSGEIEPGFVMSVPFYRDERLLGAVIGTFSADSFRQMLGSDFLVSDGYSFICDSQGTVISNTRSSSLDGCLLELIQEGNSEKEKVLSDLSHQQAGHVAYSTDGGLRYAVYVPLGINDWALFNMVPEMAVKQYIKETTKTPYIVTAVTIALALCMTLYIYIVDRLGRKNVEIEREDLRAAVGQSGRSTIKYDIYTDTAYLIGGEFWPFDSEDLKQHFVQRLLEKSIVQQDSAGALLDFQDKMRACCLESSADLHVRTKTGDLRWIHADYTLVAAKKHNERHAIVSFYDNTEEREQELAYKKWQNDISAMMASSTCYVEVNLTTDTVERAVGPEIMLTVTEVVKNVFSRFIQEFAKKEVSKTDIGEFRKFFSKTRLLSLYAEGVYSDKIDLRSTVLGKEKWFRFEVQMAKYPSTDDIKAFIIMTNVDAEFRAKENLTKLAHRDPLTNLLNRTTLESSIKKALSQARPDDLSAMFIIDLDNFKKLNDTKGHQAGDTALHMIAEAMNKTFRHGDIIGRLGGDEFMAFLPNCAVETLPAIKAAMLVEATQIFVDGMSVSSSVGVSICRGGKKEFVQMYRESDAALYTAKTMGKSRYCISGDVPTQPDADDSKVWPVQYKTLLENIEGGIILADVDSDIHITYISPSFYKAFNQDADELKPTKESLINHIYPEDVNIVLSSIRKTADSGEVSECVYRGNLCGKGWRHLRVAKNNDKEDGSCSIIAMVSDITELKQSELQLRTAEERYRVAMSQTSGQIWEVDLATHTMYIEDRISTEQSNAVQQFENAPESVIEAGIVGHKNENDFRQMFDDIYNMREGSGYCYVMLGKDGQYEWVKSRFGFLRNEKGIPYRAIGVSEKVNNIDSEMQAFEEELHFMDLMRPMLLGAVCINLSKDTLECSTLPDKLKHIKSYSAQFEMRGSIIIQDDNFQAVSEKLKLESLISGYHCGHSWVLVEFLRQRISGQPRWTSIVMRLTRHPISGDIFAFAYIKDIEVVKHWELGISTPVEINGTSLLYNKDTFAEIFHSAIRNASPGKLCSLTLFEIADIERIKAENGLSTANLIFITLARLCRIVIAGDSAVGRLDESHIVVLSTELFTPEEQRSTIELYQSRISSILTEIVHGQEINLICGYSVEPTEQADFSEMTRRALVACKTAKQYRGDGIVEYVCPSKTDSPVKPETDEKKLKILIADEDPVSRALLNKILSTRYIIDQVENGAQALQMISRHDYEMLLCDLQMPVMTGWDVLESMKIDKKFSEIPVMIVTSDPQVSSVVRALNMGATDVLRKPFEPEILLSRVRNIIGSRKMAQIAEQNRLYELLFQEQARSLLLAERDELTGVLIRQAFYRRVREILDKNPDRKYMLLRWDIDNFKIYNDAMGVLSGDKLLRELGAFMRSDRNQDILYGRIEADHFVMLVPENTRSPEEISESLNDVLSRHSSGFMMNGRMGVYKINEPGLEPSIMCDRAMLALRSIKGNFNKKIGFYDESLLRTLIQERALSTDMLSALENGQFMVYFQPQFNYETGEMIGVEALARWNHPKNGIISPGVFIPLFEKNGFISKLDEFIWERCCKYIRGWLDIGIIKRPIPVSVNISRLDLYDANVCDKISALIKKYDLPPYALHLEITESAYMQNPEQLVQMVKKLQAAGFTVEMDDFGSGYSSLNTLKDVPVNILKLDVRFLSKGEDDSRGGNILSSVLRMAHWLKLPVIAEGVETKAQAEYLKSLNCAYMQGYYFSKPLPAEKFEKQLKDTNICVIDSYSSADMVGMADFWDPSAQSALIFSNFVGGAAIIEYRNDMVELVRANDSFFSEVCTTRELFANESLNMLDHFEGENRDKFKKMLEDAVSSGKETKCEVMSKRSDGKNRQIWTLNRSRMLAKNENSYLIYTAVECVSDRHNLEERNRKQGEEIYRTLLLSKAEEERDKLIMRYLGSLVFYYDFQRDLFCYKYEKDDGTQQTRTIENYLQYLPHSQVVHPDFVERYRDTIINAKDSAASGTVEYIADNYGKGYRWCRAHYTSVADDTGRVFELVGVVYDIQEEKERNRLIKKLGEKLGEKNDCTEIDDDVLERIVSYLYSASDKRSAIYSILEVLGEHYNVSRTYIFEDTYDHEYCCNTYEWCAPGIKPEIDQLRYVSYEKDLGEKYRENFNEDGVFFCADISILPKEQYDVLAPQGIRAMLQCAIMDEGVFSGYIGFDDCKNNRVWTKEQVRTLSLSAKLIGTFLVKDRDKRTESEK